MVSDAPMAEEADSLDRKQRLNTDEFRDPSNAGLSRAYEGLFWRHQLVDYARRLFSSLLVGC